MHPCNRLKSVTDAGLAHARISHLSGSAPQKGSTERHLKAAQYGYQLLEQCTCSRVYPTRFTIKPEGELK